MNYIGSKLSLLPFISQTIRNVVGKDLSGMVFCDIFAGTGIVGTYYKPKVKQVIANDWEYYSYVLNRNYIGNHRELSKKDIYIDRLNSLPGTEGLIYNYYCSGSGSGRQYFSDENGKSIDAARQSIENWFLSGEICEDLYFFLLSSLLESADKHANTASVYGAFLKHIKASANKPMLIKPANFSVNNNEHLVYRDDANKLINRICGDILYLDPPYNSRQYGANYHILNTIAEYKPFVPKGRTGLREYNKSMFCGKKTASSALESIIREARFKYIILSYNNEGIMSIGEIEKIMQRYGYYQAFSQDYQRFRADKEDNRHHSASKTKEFLHVLEKK